MSINSAILLNGILDLAIVLAVAATMLFALDRRENEAAVYAFATPLPKTSPPSAARSPQRSPAAVCGTIFITVRGPRH